MLPRKHPQLSRCKTYGDLLSRDTGHATLHGQHWVRSLQPAGLIRQGRASITVTDRVDLEAAAVECYGKIRRLYKRLLLSLPRCSAQLKRHRDRSSDVLSEPLQLPFVCDVRLRHGLMPLVATPDQAITKAGSIRRCWRRVATRRIPGRPSVPSVSAWPEERDRRVARNGGYGSSGPL